MSTKHFEQIAKNDLLIFNLIQDQNYRIKEDGVVETLVQINGKVGTGWRVAGTVHTDGYIRMRYQGVNIRVHRVIWAKFTGYLDNNMVINHRDGNKLNNAFSNLEIITHAQNQIHAYRAGLKNIQRGNAKVPWARVDEIRADRANGYTLRKLNEKYGVSKATLSNICSGKSYREELKDGSN